MSDIFNALLDDLLLYTWEQWDKSPTNEKTASRMVEVVRVKAHELGVTNMQLRNTLAQGRQDGLTHIDALAYAERELRTS